MPPSMAARLVRSQAVIEAFRLARDGASVVYVRRIVERDRYRSHLWSAAWNGGSPRRLTTGAVRDGGPSISPDGRSVAFIRAPADSDDAVTQAWIVPLDGGEPWQLTSLKRGVTSVHWSPDGRRLAVVAEAGADRFAVGREREGKAPMARRITRLDYRNDEAGNLGHRSHLSVVAARARARPRRLTSGDFDVGDVSWSPDGRLIAFAADQGPDANIAPRSRIFAVPAAGGSLRELASLAGDAARPAFSPDGRWLAFLGTDVDDPPDWVAPQLWLVPASGGTPRSLTDHLDLPVGGWAWSDLALSEEVPGPIWVDEGALLVLVGRRGRSLPYRVTLDGEAEPLIEVETPVGGAGLAHAAGRTALTAGVDGRAAEVYAVEGRRLRAVTRDGSSWQRRFPAFRIEELSLPGPAGPMQAWLASPADSGRRRLPLVLHLHGGPTSSWAPGGTADAMLLTAAGYRVVMPNIRGSATFGADWVRALAGRWGDVDAADALGLVDTLVERGVADPRRLGVMGLSYGGFLTQWLVGITDRFAAAVAENGVSNQVSAWGTSYFGVHFNRRAGLADPLTEEGMTRLWSSSPMRNLAHISTPLLILQAEEDRICPPSDSEQLFAALKVLGRETELILYPEEHHELKNTGRPDRRIDRHERILAWFDRFFGGGG